MTDHDFCDWELHDEPENQCPECGTLRWYEPGSSNLLPCYDCGYGKPEDEEDAGEYEIRAD